jgi:choline dehydrogenase
MLRVRGSRIRDLEPFMRAGLEAAAEMGLPILEDFDERDAIEGASAINVNAVGDVRWNAAFAYLDQARERPNLTVVGDALVDRLCFERDRATGALIRVGGDDLEITADLIVLTAGAYGSPAILFRSGIGPRNDLADLSIDVRQDLPGVGRNLADHPRVEVVYRPTAELITRTNDHLARRPDRAQTLIKARSEVCPPDTWDLHVMMRVRRPLATDPDAVVGDPLAHLYVHAMKPASRGSVRLRSKEPDALPMLDHGFLSDPVGADMTTLLAGVRFARRLAQAPSVRDLLEEEIAPGPASGSALEEYVAGSVGGYWHPVGTCAMGAAGDPDAVVDASGLLHGSENVYLADASIMPTIPRSNTQLPVVAIAERISDLLRGR